MVVNDVAEAPCARSSRLEVSHLNRPAKATANHAGGDDERRKGVSTLRAMSPEEPADDGAPEPDDAPSGPPPDPLDRPWVHPTELSSFVATPALPPRETRPREWVIGLSSATVAVVVTMLVLVAFGALGGRHRSPVPPPVVTSPNEVIDYAVAQRVGVAVSPSVVTVRVYTDTDAEHPAGSGIVIRSDRVITDAHLLIGATKVDIVTQNGQTVSAKVLGADPQTDLALLDIDGGELTLAALGSSTLKVGQAVVAVAATRLTHYRLGINVVSDLDQMADTGTGTAVAGLIETGITTNAEMAGGALADANGNVVGILTYPTSGPGNGLAVPVSVMRDVADQFDASGKVSHGWIGVVYGDDATDPPPGGAVVQGVFPQSPAQSAGLAPGDVITRAGAQTVSGKADAIAAARSLRPQDPLELTYLRNGHPHDVRVTLGAGDPALFPTWPQG
jgi:S1-C subfamily serine protease